ncbi:MAG: hypothetical protein ACODAJ_04615 [Planctomycetota bacterium]
MRRRLNKETVLFLLAAALCAWVLVKLGLFLAGGQRQPRVPSVAGAQIQIGEDDLRSALQIPSLDRYAARGSRHDPFHDAERPTSVYVRRTVEHRLDAATCRSTVRVECRMIPEPLRELRVTLPDAGRLADVGGPHVAPLRAVRREGSVLVVPLVPRSIDRGHHQAVIELALDARLPSADGPWLVPVVVCTGATPRVQTEHGDLTLVIEPDSDLTAVPDMTAATGSGLTRLAGDAAPDVFAYHFTRPAYRLPVVLTHHRKTGPDDVIAERGGERGKEGGKRTGKRGKAGRGKTGKTGTAGTVLPPPLDRRRFQLTIFLDPERPRRGPQAVIRDRSTGELYRGGVGDVIDGGLQIVQIRDSAVVLRDPAGQRFICHGRFDQP